MYSFQPLIDTSTSHLGWYLWIAVAVVIFAVIMGLLRDNEIDVSGFVILMASFGFLTLMIYDGSYGTKRPVNLQVTATFVGYHSEGYNERSGKNRADVHNIYVIYKIDDTGNDVLLHAGVGREYPRHVVLYKN